MRPGPATPATEAPDRRRYALLDILRYVAAMMVAIMHWGLENWGAGHNEAYRTIYDVPVVGFLLEHGAIGVQIFFVISGFVIIQSAHAASWRTFLIARVVRLFPALLVCMVLVLFVGSRFIHPFPTPVRSLIHSVFLTYGIAGVDPLASQLWTLLIEVPFYGGVAALLLAIPRVMHARWGVMGLLAAWEYLSTLPSPLGVMLSLGNNAHFFALGIAIHLLTSSTALKERAVIALLLIQPVMRLLTPLSAEGICIGIFAALVAGSPWLDVPPRLARVTRLLGLASYPIYLLHSHVGIALINIWRAHVANHLPSAAGWAAVVLTVGCVALAVAIERPLQRSLRRWLSPAEFRTKSWSTVPSSTAT